MSYKKSKRKNGRTSAIVALCIVAALTIFFGVLGLNGVSFPPRGLYKLLPWLPTSDSENWPASLPLGLDLRGGMFVEFTAKVPEGSDADPATLLEGTMTVIQQRLTDKGITEANVQSINAGGGIRVEIPNTSGNEMTDEDMNNMLDLIGSSAKLEFKDPDGNVFMTGDMVKTATYHNSEGDHEVAFTLTDEGARIFGDMTSKSIGKTIAIYLDGVELISPTVQSAITAGTGVINGMGTKERATTIAAQIQSGALPMELTQDKVDKVSATLGKDALSTSVTAALIGILLVMVLMIIRYRLNGVVASWALCIYTIVLFLLIALFSVQLTLPGLAGVVLGIGMAVDANVVIFERFNEEIRAGKSTKASVRAGFKNAMSAVLDANVTTLIAAIVLMIFGTGSIQGFAKTLLLGVLVSMLSAVLVTRFLMNKIVDAGAKEPKLFTKVNAVKEVEQ